MPNPNYSTFYFILLFCISLNKSLWNIHLCTEQDARYKCNETFDMCISYRLPRYKSPEIQWLETTTILFAQDSIGVGFASGSSAGLVQNHSCH